MLISGRSMVLIAFNVEYNGVIESKIRRAKVNYSPKSNDPL